MQDYVRWLHEVSMKDLNLVGGKNASLGEMIQHLSKAGVKVPPGFATTTTAFHHFLETANLKDTIRSLLENCNPDDVKQLTKVGKSIRDKILAASFSADFIASLKTAYEQMAKEDPNLRVAVRSSATAEDLADASFAGQQETYLNIEGFDNVLLAIKQVFASLYNDRAIAYRVHQGFTESTIGLSAGIQKMIRSDLATSGVLFSIDTESGFDKVVFITAAYGLGELVVQGVVNPDEYYLYKDNLKNNLPALVRKTCGKKQEKMIFADKGTKTVPVPADLQQQFCLTEDELTYLGHQALLIEKHYGRPMDIEWAKDGDNGALYIVQARPETVRSLNKVQLQYRLQEHTTPILEGRSIGQRIGKGRVRVLQSIKDMHSFEPGEVLVADLTDPDWEPIMKKAAAIVTNRGGRTCHAAIIARELEIPAVVGTLTATQVLKTGDTVTVSCAEGDTGYIYPKDLQFTTETQQTAALAPLPVKMMLNVGNPDRAFTFAQMPHQGVGLARLEFIIGQTIGIHPKACLHPDTVDATTKNLIAEKIHGYPSAREFYVQKLVEGLATLACAFAPHPVIARFSDFKSNEYANLIGGKQFEPIEENPMMGYRGASRYISDFAECFALEVEAVLKVRNILGFKNLQVMVPFVRTLEEAKKTTELLASMGLKRPEVPIYMMCEVPSNALLAEAFLEYFDGFSIGSNDLTQLTLGIDRDSGLVAGGFNERDPAVLTLLKKAITACHKQNKYVGICGQGPSDHPDFALWLLQENITSLSLNPDSLERTWQMLNKSLNKVTER